MTAFDIDRHAERLARTQHGAFSRRQIVGLGATRHMVSGRLRNGRWIQLAPSVYALPSHPGTWHRALMAAVLAERQAAVAGRAAAALHGLSGFRPGRAEIVVPSGRNHHPGDVLIHRSDAFRSTVVLAVPVLTVCDTLFMLAGLVERPRLQFALDDALAAGIVSVDSLQSRYLSFAGSRRPGLPRMRQRDRVRDRVASAHGFATLRFTHGDLSRPAEVTAAEILAVFRSFQALPQRLAG